MSDIYSAPESELTSTNEGSTFGTLEKGIAGDYELTFGGIFDEATSKLKGSKTPILLAFLLMIAVSIGIGILAGIISTAIAALGLPIIGAIASQLISFLVTMPLYAGVAIIGMRLIADKKSQPTSIFNHYDKIIPIFITTLLMYIMIIIGTLLLILPGIYLTIAYLMAIPLVVEKDLSPWQALEASRKTITHKWFLIFGVSIVLWLIVTLSMIPLFIGLIWTLPLSVLIMSAIYKKTVGIENSTLED